MAEEIKVPAEGQAQPQEVKSDGPRQVPMDPDLVTFVIQYNKNTHDCNVNGMIYVGMDLWYAAIGIATDKVRKLNEMNYGYCVPQKIESQKKGGIMSFARGKK